MDGRITVNDITVELIHGHMYALIAGASPHDGDKVNGIISLNPGVPAVVDIELFSPIAPAAIGTNARNSML